jgi:hypothetical protein
MSIKGKVIGTGFAGMGTTGFLMHVWMSPQDMDAQGGMELIARIRAAEMNGLDIEIGLPDLPEAGNATDEQAQSEAPHLVGGDGQPAEDLNAVGKETVELTDAGEDFLQAGAAAGDDEMTEDLDAPLPDAPAPAPVEEPAPAPQPRGRKGKPAPAAQPQADAQEPAPSKKGNPLDF